MPAMPAWLLKYIDLPRLFKRAVAIIKGLVSRSSGAPANAGRGAVPNPLSPNAADVDDTGRTVLVQRGNFGSITCVSGTLLGKRWEIPAQGLSLGREPSSDIVIDDPVISAKHAHILPKNGQVVIVDDGSRNGVFLDAAGSRIQVQGERALQPGDLVLLSATDAAHFIYRK
jgi:hypothetical protein